MNGEEQWKSEDRRSVEIRLNTWGGMNIKTQRSIYRETVKRVKTFTYLRSTLAENRELDAEVTHRVQNNWKRVSGLLCDRRMNVKIKGKVYRTVVRPALMHGAETWALKTAQEKSWTSPKLECIDGGAELRI